MSVRSLRPFALLASLVLITAMLGCIEIPGSIGEGPGEDGVTLMVEFGSFEPSLHPGKRAVWSPDGRGNWTVDIDDAWSEGTVYTVHNVSAETVLGVLIAAGSAAGFPLEHHTESMGAFVDSIDGVKNGRDGHFWSYYLNGEYGGVASDNAFVSEGDLVRWVYMGNPFG